LLVLAAGVAVAAASASARTSATPSASRCGGSTWRMKTMSDAMRKSVALTPKTATVGAIIGKPYPNPVPRRRRTSFQRQSWEVVAQITAYRLEDAGVRLILYDDGAYVNAVVPAPSCLTSLSRGRAAMNAAWNTFFTKCARPSRDWQSLGAILYVRGVGLWTDRRGERGAARNGAELYPVTGFRVIAGC
jgi:hypothetical protein